MKQGLDLQRVQFKKPSGNEDIVVVTWQPELYSNQRFLLAAHDLGQKLIFLNPEEVRPSIKIPKYFLRLGSYRFKENIEKLSLLDVRFCNSLSLSLLYRDKIETYKIWQRHNIPFPKSLILDLFQLKILNLDEQILWKHIDASNSPNYLTVCHFLSENTKESEKEFIIKFPTAIKGQGVYLIKSQKDLDTILKLAGGANDLSSSRLLIQKYYSESYGEDIRSFHINEEHFSITRKNLNDFRSNLSQGGKALPYALSEQEKSLCYQVFKLSQLDYAGIDFIKTSKGPLFLEINVSPGFEGIEKTLNVDIAKKILSVSF